MSTRTSLPSEGFDRTASSRAEHYPELHANHLLLAQFLRVWAQDLQGDLGPTGGPTSEVDFLLGYQRALRDCAEHLTDGDGLPGGAVTVHLTHRQVPCA